MNSDQESPQPDASAPAAPAAPTSTPASGKPASNDKAPPGDKAAKGKAAALSASGPAVQVRIDAYFAMRSEKLGKRKDGLGASVKLGAVLSVVDHPEIKPVRTNRFGSASLKLSSLPPGSFTLRIVPEGPHQLRADLKDLSPVGSADNFPSDRLGNARFRPLEIAIEMKEKGQLSSASVPAGTIWGNVEALSSTTLLVDWKADWIALNKLAARRNGQPPSLLVLHRTEGPTAPSALSNFFKTHLSIHYLVSQDGHLIKCAPESLAAQHAGKNGASRWAGNQSLNGSTLGIEIVNQGGPFTDAQYDTVARIVGQLRAKFAISRHGVLAHADIRVQSNKDFTLIERNGCPGVFFDWSRLENAGLVSKPDPAGFNDADVDSLYGGLFKDLPDFGRPEAKGRSKVVTDEADDKLTDSKKKPYGVFAALQQKLISLGYSVNAKHGEKVTGRFDAATQAALDRFRRRYVPGAVPNNQDLSAHFDKATAIALERVLADRAKP
jgi:N-acetyl-anhydromuramyl-L-alanine amidase AmpD